MNLLPNTSGTYHGEVRADFLPSLSKRIRSGLFPMASARRNQYEIVSEDEDSLRFRSNSVLTGINVGLNEVSVTVDRKANCVRFEIAYWTWAKYVIMLSAAIVSPLLLCFAAKPLLPAAWFEGYDQAPALAWAMMFFWGLVWPWILINMHKPNVRRCLTNIFDELGG